MDDRLWVDPMDDKDRRKRTDFWRTIPLEGLAEQQGLSVAYNWSRFPLSSRPMTMPTNYCITFSSTELKGAHCDLGLGGRMKFAVREFAAAGLYDLPAGGH